MTREYSVVIKKICDQCGTAGSFPCTWGNNIKEYLIEAENPKEAMKAAGLHAQMDMPRLWLEQEAVVVRVRLSGESELLRKPAP